MEILNDNCCGCNAAAYSHLCDLPNVTLVYITYHVDVGETPFLVAVDYEWRTVVVSIRGTLSLKVESKSPLCALKASEDIFSPKL